MGENTCRLCLTKKYLTPIHLKNEEKQNGTTSTVEMIELLAPVKVKNKIRFSKISFNFNVFFCRF